MIKDISGYIGAYHGGYYDIRDCIGRSMGVIKGCTSLDCSPHGAEDIFEQRCPGGSCGCCCLSAEFV